ncbi:MAG TPA: penicillin-binding protein 2 [Solirubrobacterales bacterium]|nr:penicillin-binding protein 2 [Solirubrobacterales bacterium]
MYLRTDDRRPPLSTGLALRVAIIGGVTLALFAVLLFRLWYLQVLSGDRYLAEANDNRTREVRVAAPRGEILDRSGKVLVRNRVSLALQVDPQKLPRRAADRQGLLSRIGNLAGIPPRRLRRTLHEEVVVSPTSPATLIQDVPSDLFYYVRENQDRFPGVDAGRVFVRRYPNGTLGAHLFGNVNEISDQQLKEPRYRNLEPGDLIGQDGIEYSYDRYLRGQAGVTRVQVDSFGRPKGELSVSEPKPGDNLRLTIDSRLQAAGEGALAAQALPGAFVAMDTSSGAILAMGSSPTYDPADLINPTQAEVDAIYRDPVAAPIYNRAISGLYPTGSTFKPITSIAALASGVVTPFTTIIDDGAFTLGGITFQNAGGASYGALTMQPALQVSSDVFYYTLGNELDKLGPGAHGTMLQRWARRLGIGHETGIDLPGEQPGLLPTPAWRNQLYRKDLTDRPWSGGDAVNLAVGQGDLQANPLQMAVAYSTIANGGTVVRPHVGGIVEDAAGRVVREIEPGAARELPIEPQWRQTILDGLHDAAQSPGGTSYSVFGGFKVPVAGKTGTAERPPYADQSWYVVLAPYPDPEIVVAATFEQGGFGVDAAAPAAATILSEYYNAAINAPGTGGIVE